MLTCSWHSFVSHMHRNSTHRRLRTETTPKVKSLKIWFSNWKTLPSLIWTLDPKCNLQQIRMNIYDLSNFIVIFKATEQRYGRTSTWAFFSTIREVYWRTCISSFLKPSGKTFFKPLLFKKNSIKYLWLYFKKISVSESNSICKS